MEIEIIGSEIQRPLDSLALAVGAVQAITAQLINENPDDSRIINPFPTAKRFG